MAGTEVAGNIEILLLRSFERFSIPNETSVEAYKKAQVLSKMEKMVETGRDLSDFFQLLMDPIEGVLALLELLIYTLVFLIESR